MSYTIKNLLQFLIISFVIIRTNGFCFSFSEGRFQVHNSLPSNSPPLTLHCASGDKELGFHNLTTNQDFNYNFCVNPYTLFFCHLWWNGKNIAFDVYRQEWASKRCDRIRVCYWEARSDGIYSSIHRYPPTPTNVRKVFSW
ncbi:hypothetical protein PHJA_002091000 [Phtheirospermum japonicum]|uniref:S-protein homolog n=1 Tax=Phtheirospermum japonicum TaxID=374723 RepID=A0A830CKF7_9LAMI|nr:hypothetical protein PHJA_002091000 [Phtheirospermum japonicum]